MDVDALSPQRGEETPGDAGAMAHVGAHHGDDGEIAIHHQIVDEARLPLAVELPVDQGLGVACALRIDGQADRVLARGLADEDHVDAGVGEGAEQALRRAGHPHHPVAFEAQQGDAGDGADPPHRVLAGRHSSTTRVPGKGGFRVFLITNGIEALRAGCTVGG